MISITLYICDMETKYYTPEIEDLKIGYKFEANELPTMWESGTGKEWEKFTLTEWDLYSDEDSKSYLESVMYAIKEGKIRTKYLDKQDIESLGWEYNEKNKKYNKHYDYEYYESFDYNLEHIENQNSIHITLTYRSSKESFENQTSFIGKCPSINELKYIQKLLGIK